jgi:hypothetical protein
MKYGGNDDDNIEGGCKEDLSSKLRRVESAGGPGVVDVDACLEPTWLLAFSHHFLFVFNASCVGPTWLGLAYLT